jgi:hypothetical protein
MSWYKGPAMEQHCHKVRRNKSPKEATSLYQSVQKTLELSRDHGKIGSESKSVSPQRHESLVALFSMNTP